MASWLKTLLPNVKAGRTAPPTVVEKSDTEIYAAGEAILPSNIALDLFAKRAATHVSATYLAGVEDENGSSLDGTRKQSFTIRGGLDILFHTMSALIYNLLLIPLPKKQQCAYCVRCDGWCFSSVLILLA